MGLEKPGKRDWQTVGGDCLSLGQNGWHIAREDILEKEGQKCAVTTVMST